VKRMCEKCHEYPKHRDTKYCRKCLAAVRSTMEQHDREEAYYDHVQSIRTHNRRAGRDV